MDVLVWIGFSLAFVIMVIWPTMDGWFEDLERGDDAWEEDWYE